MSGSPWRASVFTLFPGMFPGPLGTSLAGEALSRGVWSCEAIDIRDQGLGRHRTVDDRPAGGGPGMVMRADVVAASLDSSLADDDGRPRLIMSPRGRPLTQRFVRDLVGGAGVVLVCGRFEGIDERVVRSRHLTEVSIGDYILSGGEIAAMVLLDACVRLLPGVMGADASGLEESFENALLEYPHYTRPRDFEGMAIPDVLLSGDHKRIAAWRLAESERITRERRPDLLDRAAEASPNLDLPSPASRNRRRDMTTSGDEVPPFGAAFEQAGTGDGWIAVRHRDGHRWRFDVTDKNGRRQLVHHSHQLAGTAPVSERLAFDAYDYATLEARRLGWCD